MKRTRLSRKARDQPMALIGDARSALSSRIKGILNCRRLTGDERILAIIYRPGISVGHTYINTACYPPINRKRCTVVDTRCRALKFVDPAKFRDRASERIDEGRERAAEAALELPRGEETAGRLPA